MTLLVTRTGPPSSRSRCYSNFQSVEIRGQHGKMYHGHTVDDRNPASPYIHTDVLNYQDSYTFGISGLCKLMPDFYNERYQGHLPGSQRLYGALQQQPELPSQDANKRLDDALYGPGALCTNLTFAIITGPF